MTPIVSLSNTLIKLCVTCGCALGRLQSLSLAQPLEGPFMQRYRQLAQSTELWLSLGGFQERGPDPGHNFNCHVIVSDQGELVATYRKVGHPVHRTERCDLHSTPRHAWGASSKHVSTSACASRREGWRVPGVACWGRLLVHAAARRLLL
jgi:hypothetical protein